MEDDRNPLLNLDGVISPPPRDDLALNRTNERIVPHPQRRTLGDFFLPNVDNANYRCFAPPILAKNFKIKPGTIQLLESCCQFYGLESEDPNAHLSKFTEVCNTFKIHNVTEDQIKLCLVPFSLRDKARNWIQSLPSTSITTWKQLAQAFLNKYFSRGKTARMTKETIDFFQLHGESLYQAWERFKELKRICPHHHLGRVHLISIFYNGTNERTRATIDAASGGSLMKKTYGEANNLLEELATNSSQLEMYKQQANQRNAQLAVVQMGCETCDGHDHSGMDCPVLHQNSNEQVNYVNGQRQGNDPYSSTYNPGWRNHPNFAWRDNSGEANANTNMGGENFQGGNRGPPNQGNFKYHRPQHPPGSQQNRNADEGSKIDKLIEEVRSSFKNQTSVNHHLETQFSQLAISLQNRAQGGLPSTTESNPREQVKAIELQSGKELDDPHASKESTIDLPPSTNEEEVTELPYVKLPPPPPFVPKVPFPGRLKKTPDNQNFQ
ncbi:uncharacterized protein LOC126681618 [Mercurialis annua]|uniref:uncharacterized protein LOC126681618 n=1 Tax=Mercurialis annua TaxID=3986 RepID=UPI00215E3A24|nr:uncharacterized protein LOC126681618 [Mercurialis annua]